MNEQRRQTLRTMMIDAGWDALDSRTDPRAYRDTSGTSFGTLEKDGVRIALSIGLLLMPDKRGSVTIYQGEDHDAILEAILVDPDRRGNGLASQAMRQLVAFADTLETVMYLEPAPIQDKPLGKEELTRFYSHFGFSPEDTRGLVMIRQPCSLPIS